MNSLISELMLTFIEVLFMELATAKDKLFPPDKIFLAPAGIKGLGVFASQSIEEGELVEKVPVRKVPVSIEKHLKECSETLYRYLFWWKGNASDQEPVEAAIAFGFGSFYNHSSSPNLTLEYDFVNCFLSFVAVREIFPNEELTFDYGDDLWFAVME